MNDFHGKEERKKFTPERKSFGSHSRTKDSPGPLESIQRLDQDILNLLLKRSRMLDELPSGREAVKAEKKLRSSWEEQAAKFSRDPKLIKQMFALIQEIECIKKTSSYQQAEAFNLNPSRQAVDIKLNASADCRQTRLLGAIAAITGNSCHLHNILVNDPLIGLVKAFNQLVPSLRWEEDGQLLCKPEHGLEINGTENGILLDKAVHTGDNFLNFMLLLFTMAIRPCRLKIMGESDLKLTDLSPIRHFMPSLGARFTSIIPGQDGLPARLESSGLLPEYLDIAWDLPEDAVLALCLAMICERKKIIINLNQHPQADQILSELQYLCTLCNYNLPLSDKQISLDGSALLMPAEIKQNIDISSTAIWLAIPAFNGGQTSLNLNKLNLSAEQHNLSELLQASGLKVELSEEEIKTSPSDAGFSQIPQTNDSLLPLSIALLCLQALKNKQAELPDFIVEKVNPELLNSFLEHINLTLQDNKLILADNNSAVSTAWVSPSPEWTMAFALVALVAPRKGIKLVNPGIITEHLPQFWQIYNSLPKPVLAAKHVIVEEEKTQRRRVRAGFMPKEHMPEPLKIED